MNPQSEEMRRELEEIFNAFPNIRTTDIPGIDLYMDQVTTFLQENLRGVSRDPEGDKFLTKTMINNYVKNKVLIPPVKKKYSRDHMMLLIMIYYMKSFLSISDISTITGPIMDRYAEAPVDPKKDAAERKKEAAERKKEAAERRREKEKGKDSDRKNDAALSQVRDPDQARKTSRKLNEEEKGKEAGKEKDLRIHDIYETIIADIESDIPHIHEDILKAIELSEGVFADVPEEDRPLLQRFALICRLSAEVYMRKLFIEKLLDTTQPPEGQN